MSFQLSQPRSSKTLPVSRSASYHRHDHSDASVPHAHMNSRAENIDSGDSPHQFFMEQQHTPASRYCIPRITYLESTYPNKPLQVCIHDPHAHLLAIRRQLIVPVHHKCPLNISICDARGTNTCHAGRGTEATNIAIHRCFGVHSPDKSMS